MEDRVRELEGFRRFLVENEKSAATIQKYLFEVGEFYDFLGDREADKLLLVQYRERLQKCYRPQTVNGKLSAVHAYLGYVGRRELRVKYLKVQRRADVEERRELTQGEYRRLLEAAKRRGREQLYYIMVTLCSTGIRISELEYITVEAVNRGRAEVCMKGNNRIVILPRSLVIKLKDFARKRAIKKGSIFCSRNGRPLDRSNICHEMKKNCGEAGVEESKVFPHNLRHLFARCFYAVERDLSHLADILGHSSIETTRIYVAASIRDHEYVINRMNIGINE